MLAVLTTTHRLKVFEPQGHPEKPWKAVHDIGQLIEDYDGWEGTKDSRVQRLRIRSRCEHLYLFGYFAEDILIDYSNGMEQSMRI